MDNSRYYQYLDALKYPAVVSVGKLEFLNPDNTVAFDIGDDFFQDGTLSVNFQNGARRSASIVINNWDEIYAVNVNKLWIGQLVRLSAGLRLHDGTDYFIQQGTFYITNPEEVFEPTNHTIRMNLVDKWAGLDGTIPGSSLDGIYQINPNDDLFVAIRQLLALDRGNGMVLDAVPPVFDSYYNDKTSTLTDGTTIPFTNAPYTLRTEADKTYADVLLGINTMLVSTIGYDAAGQLRIQSAQTDIRDSERPVMWNFSVQEKELYSTNTTHDTSNMYNDVVVTGAIVNGVQVKGRATNRNPASDCCVQRIGRKTYTVTDSKLYTYEQCNDLAKYWLRKLSAPSKSVSFNTTPIYHLSENNLITLLRPAISGKPEKYLVTGYTLPIGGVSAMTINAVSVNDYDMGQPNYTLSVFCSDMEALIYEYVDAAGSQQTAGLTNPYDIVEIPPGYTVNFSVSDNPVSPYYGYTILSATLNNVALEHDGTSCSFIMPEFDSDITFVLSAVGGVALTYTYTGTVVDTPSVIMGGISYRLLKFTTDGTLTFDTAQLTNGITADIWVRGAGGGGNTNAIGGNGYEKKIYGATVVNGAITIGAGGAAGTTRGSRGSGTSYGSVIEAPSGAGASGSTAGVGGSLTDIYGCISDTSSGKGGLINGAGQNGVIYMRFAN